MYTEKIRQVTYNGISFTVKNILPNIKDSERNLLLQNISNDLKKALSRMS